ncbi:MAG TPA: cupin domain-containing protein [Phnomibacter sp.]|nr:cupin domain-containing protein [Phnomibacter sp.]
MKTLALLNEKSLEMPVQTAKKASIPLWFWLILYPAGLIFIWKTRVRFVWKLLYSLVAAPLTLLSLLYAGILVFSAFLPPLDRSVGNRTDRTIVNSEGNYSATFIKTARETNNAYELVQVELEPHGGNDWHYHNRFTEEFTVLKGSVNIGHEGKVQRMEPGPTYAVTKDNMHYFKNALNERSWLMVKVIPAGGLEKTLRVAYGLINDGLLKNDMTQNPWHMCLLLAYSESYLPGMPTWFQEPLINALAKIAQWKGEDRALYKYFK